MIKDRLLRIARPAIWMLLGVVLGIGSMVAAQGGEIQACANNATGALRVVASAGDCRHNETPLTWNLMGPPGPQGEQGPPGPPGLVGVYVQTSEAVFTSDMPNHETTLEVECNPGDSTTGTSRDQFYSWVSVPGGTGIGAYMYDPQLIYIADGTPIGWSMRLGFSNGFLNLGQTPPQPPYVATVRLTAICADLTP